MPPDSIGRVVVAARRRLMAMDLFRRLATSVGIVAAAGALLLGIARLVVLPWSDTAVVIAVVCAVVGARLWTGLRRPSLRRAAIELDTRLGAKDQVSTALELFALDARSPIEDAQVGRAAAWAEGRALAGFGRLTPRSPVAGAECPRRGQRLGTRDPASPADAEQDRRQADEAADRRGGRRPA